MTNDHSQDHNAPPDSGSAGDVSTTGLSGHDASGSGAAPEDPHGTTTHDTAAVDTHGGHGGHGADAPDVSTLVPTTWRQLIFPALILLLVAILVAGPVSNAFSSRPVAPSTTGVQQGSSQPANGAETGAATPTGNGTSGNGAAPTNSTATAVPSGTAVPTAASQLSPTGASLSQSVIATRTAVAVDGENGVVSRAPVQLQFANSTFAVEAGNDLLPDWKPSQDPGTATWLEGTFANHILYLPFSTQNSLLFSAARPGDQISLKMNSGQVFFFSITRSERAANGPPASQGQFTVTGAMAQDHAGVTLFLIGDSTPDRAVVQADFTGNIQ